MTAPTDQAPADTPTDEAPEVPLDQLAWEAAALKAIAGQIETVQKVRVEALRERLIARYKAEGTKTTIVHAPGTKTEIGRATVTTPSDRPYVSDHATFAAWVENEAPSEVSYEVQAPREFIDQIRELLEWYTGDKTAVTIRPVIRATYQNALLESVTFVPADPDDPDAGTVAVDTTGEVVPGIAVTPAGDPTSHSFVFATKARTGAKTADNQLNGRQRAIAALMRTGFQGLTFNDVLDEARQIEG